MLAATGANSVLLVVQTVGAVAFGSIALFADVVHQASDVVSLVLAVIIALVAARPATTRFTYGYGRADALGGLTHVVLLVAGAAFVIVEALRRFGDEIDVDGGGVAVLAAIGLLVNGASAWWLHGGSDRSLNIDGAVLHLLADALGSLVVLGAGIAIVVTGADWVDPAASLVVAALILFSAARLTRNSLRVLMDGVPPDVDLDELRALLLADPLVTDAHHLHVRSLGGADLAFTGHVLVETDQLHDAQVVTRRLTEGLTAHGIGHVTLQAECHPCDAPDH